MTHARLLLSTSACPGIQKLKDSPTKRSGPSWNPGAGAARIGKRTDTLKQRPGRSAATRQLAANSSRPACSTTTLPAAQSFTTGSSTNGQPPKSKRTNNSAPKMVHSAPIGNGMSSADYANLTANSARTNSPPYGVPHGFSSGCALGKPMADTDTTLYSPTIQAYETLQRSAANPPKPSLGAVVGFWSSFALPVLGIGAAK